AYRVCIMERIAQIVVISVLASGPLVLGQTQDASQVLTAAREALGGDKLATLQTLTIEGRVARPTPSGTVERAFEMNVKLPDKFLYREVLMAMSNMSVYRLSGFNGPAGLIDEIDQPPQVGHGGSGGGHGQSAGGGMAPAKEMTPEQKRAQRAAALLANKKEYAQLALGMFAAAPAVYPLQFTYAGQAESPDGTAHVINVKDEGEFAARLFVHAKTHLPLMLIWMDKEPMLTTTGHGGAEVHGSGARGQSDHGARVSTDAHTKEADASRRLVEFRLFYGNYKSVGGLRLPHTFQRMVEGKVTEELTFDRVLVNQKIDESRFRVSR
ncbi:MAG: hypothetical protein ACREIB_02400, partial [Pseudomonadota bacterium]